MPCSIETCSSLASAGSGGCPLQNVPAFSRFVRLEMVAIRDDELAADPAAPPHIGDCFEIDLAAVHGGDTGPQHWNESRLGPGTRLHEPANAVQLILLDVDEEHVRAALLQRDGELLQEIRLQRPDADDEEAAQPDRQQNDACLIARPREAADGVAQRKPRCRCQRTHGTHQQDAGSVQNACDDREAAAHNEADHP